MPTLKGKYHFSGPEFGTLSKEGLGLKSSINPLNVVIKFETCALVLHHLVFLLFRASYLNRQGVL